MKRWTRADLCIATGCARNVHVLKAGHCKKHYYRQKQYGDANEPIRRAVSWSGATCSVDGCVVEVCGHGLCEMHYTRKRKHGSTDRVERPKRACSQCGDRYYGAGLCRLHYDRKRGARPGFDDPVKVRMRSHLRRARKAGSTGSHTHQEWLDLLDQYNGECAYCDQPADTRDHVIPIIRGGTHDIGNIVPACRSCNSRKGAKTFDEWAERL